MFFQHNKAIDETKSCSNESQAIFIQFNNSNFALFAALTNQSIQI